MKLVGLTLLIILIGFTANITPAIWLQSAQSIRITVALGTPEIVMDYSRDSCRNSGGLDLTDVQARAVRSPLDESIILISGNAPVNYTMTGPDFDHLKRNCSAALVSGESPFAYTFSNQEWILSIYRDGNIIHALIHNEFHDPLAAACKPGDSSPANPCIYNSITSAVSMDGGQTFTQSHAPDNVVAALPTPWIAPSGQRGDSNINLRGYFTPSNIIHGRDGLYYSMFFAIPFADKPAFRGTCLMRTDNLSDPGSWRAWDGTGFSIPMHSPYDSKGDPAPTGLPPCAFVSAETIGDLYGSLTFNSYFEKYILVGSALLSVNRELTCGTYFALSDDLIHWSTPQLLMTGKLPYPPCSTGNPDGSIIYPSLIDHSDTTPNFEITGQSPYLYYVLWNNGLDRDLMRLQVHFEKE